MRAYCIDPITAKTVLEAVEQWADGYIMLTELEHRELEGRPDAVLISYGRVAHCMKTQTTREKVVGVSDYWWRPRLIGIEVKVSRTDFLKGLRTGQFERYRDSQLAGLYVATGKEVCRTKELPAGVGHLVVTARPGGDWRCICRRHPSYHDVELSVPFVWCILFQVARKFRQQIRVMQLRHNETMERVGDAARSTIFRAVRQFAEKLQ